MVTAMNNVRNLRTAGMIPLNSRGQEFMKIGGGFKELNTDKKYVEMEKSPVNKEHVQERRKLREACEGFEAVFIRKLLSTMRETVGEGSMYGSGPAGDIYGDIVEGAVADTMADNSMLGLGDQLYDRMVEHLNIKYEYQKETEHGT